MDLSTILKTRTERGTCLEMSSYEMWFKAIHIGEAIDIDATPEQVWPYIAQRVREKQGWYSFSWLERLFSFHIFNTYSIVPEWQDVKPGDFLFYHQCGIGSEVKSVKINEYITTKSDTREPPEYPGAYPFSLPIGF